MGPGVLTRFSFYPTTECNLTINTTSNLNPRHNTYDSVSHQKIVYDLFAPITRFLQVIIFHPLKAGISEPTKNSDGKDINTTVSGVKTLCRFQPPLIQPQSLMEPCCQHISAMQILCIMGMHCWAPRLEEKSTHQVQGLFYQFK